MMTEGVDLHRLPSEWQREVPGFPVNRIEQGFIAEPDAAWYQISGEMLEILLRDAGWKPVATDSEEESHG